MSQLVVTARAARLFGLGLIMLFIAVPSMAAGNIAAGKGKALACASCHGADGNPPAGAPFPVIAGQEAEYLARQLRNFKSSVRQNEIMKAQVAKLSEKDILDLAAYFASVPAKTGVAHDASLVKLGERIYRGGIAKTGVSACMSCHGPSGRGIPPRFPRVSGQTASYTEQQLLAFKSAKRTSDSEIMTRIAFRMSEAEIRAVSEYINGLH